MLLFHSILTFMKDLYQSENQVFKKSTSAQSFPPPKSSYLSILSPHPPPLQNVLIFLFIFQSFSLCYSFTVSEDL